MWFFLALGSALFYSFRGILEKRIIGNVDKYILGLAIRLFAIPFFFVPFLWSPNSFISPLHLSWQFWTVVAIICCITTPIETILYYKALQTEEVTLILPILALGPALTVLWGSLTLHEIPSLFGLVGVLSLVFGVYALKIGHAKEGLLEPIHHLRNNPAIRLMFVVMLSSSLSSVLDKVGVVHSNAYMYGLINYLAVSVALFVIALYKSKHHLRQLITHKTPFLVIGTVIAAYTLLNFLALQTGFAGYVGAVRASYLLFTMIMGILFLKEKDAKQKILSGIFIVLGLILIKLFS
ncbi:MAG TPA: EamA family transporter [Patescibacteria group bacterium]|nr:EamA family transporter [Patescibacteria group bacterium]